MVMSDTIYAFLLKHEIPSCFSTATSAMLNNESVGAGYVFGQVLNLAQTKYLL